jgi:hypothetical protein
MSLASSPRRSPRERLSPRPSSRSSGSSSPRARISASTTSPRCPEDPFTSHRVEQEHVVITSVLSWRSASPTPAGSPCRSSRRRLRCRSRPRHEVNPAPEPRARGQGAFRGPVAARRIEHRDAQTSAAPTRRLCVGRRHAGSPVGPVPSPTTLKTGVVITPPGDTKGDRGTTFSKLATHHAFDRRTAIQVSTRMTPRPIVPPRRPRSLSSPPAAEAIRLKAGAGCVDARAA